MSRKSNGIVNTIVVYIFLCAITYAFSMLFIVVKYATLTAINKWKQRRLR